MKTLTHPTPKNSKMAHTAVITEYKKIIVRVARAEGVHQNVIFNTLLAEGLKHRKDLLKAKKK
jgi:hypothetical protein